MKPDDKRRTCWCGHRYQDHSKGGACLGMVDDPDASALRPCSCHRWEPRPFPEHPFYQDVLRDAKAKR